MKDFPENEYHLPFFDENGYVRKQCPKCREFYWTQKPECPTCGESTAEGCAPYTFIGNPSTRRPYSLKEMRETFLSFFKRNGHEVIQPYPVVARWRDDIYLTHASIIDFQPYVTEGIVPPPANPLVISQPCIRFVDIDNVGPTFGRHLTIFEMGGHHAFNYPDKEIYWKDETVRYHHEFATKVLGIPSEEVVYKEGVWIGGGNAGPDLESIVNGLELATLVFMKYKVANNSFVELPIRTVDTGYGIERFTWISQGTVSAFHVIYDTLLEKILKMAGIDNLDEKLLSKAAEFSGMCNLEKVVSKKIAREVIAKRIGIDAKTLEEYLLPIENVFAVADHTKCLTFMLAEGVVPSNMQEGYLARLLLRRTYRLLKTLKIEEQLPEIVNLQINHWAHDFPQLEEMRNEILDMLAVEKEKYEQTLKHGKNFVRKIAQEVKTRKQAKIPTETLIELYDSHGIPPEIVQETLANENVQVEIPETFYKMIAERNIQTEKKEEGTKEGGITGTEDMPPTRMLYYEDQYQTKFEAEVLKVLDQRFVVLDSTLFYPEGGGQPADQGTLEFDGKQCKVVDAQKIGNVIIHRVEGKTPPTGTRVKGTIDWERRNQLMKHHTATHVLMGAARRVLGRHVWQAGTQKEFEQARLDISHYKKLTLEDIQRIETLANEAVLQRIPVETLWMPRNEAEKRYGFRLYQGGAVPGKEIRVVKTGEWEVEACAGTHVKNTSELGLIKILRTERIQDGVERIVFSAGLPALRKIQERERLLEKISDKLNAPLEKLESTVERLLIDYREARRDKERLVKEIAARDTGRILNEKAEITETREIAGLRLVTREFMPLDVERMIRTASEIIKKEPKAVTIFSGKDQRTARLVVMAGNEAVEKGVDACEIAKHAAAVLGGGGSGRVNFAQGGGTRVDKTVQALKKAEEILARQLKTRITD